jgi:hypothetical protein
MAATAVNSEAPPDLDQRIVLRDVSWEQYEALLALFGDDPPGIRMAYLGEDKEFPDIAFEVVLTSGGVNRLAIYAGLGVAEVWLWRNGIFEIYRLGPTGYERRERSGLLPELDFAPLVPLVEMQDQTRALQTFRDALRR